MSKTFLRFGLFAPKEICHFPSPLFYSLGDPQPRPDHLLLHRPLHLGRLEAHPAGGPPLRPAPGGTVKTRRAPGSRPQAQEPQIAPPAAEQLQPLLDQRPQWQLRLLLPHAQRRRHLLGQVHAEPQQPGAHDQRERGRGAPSPP